MWEARAFGEIAGKGVISMRSQRLVVVLVAVVVLVLAVPATSSAAAKWLTDPTCTATSTTLACSGRATGVARQKNNPLGAGLSPLQAGIALTVRYTCQEPLFDFYEGGYASVWLFGVDIRNGHTFVIDLSPWSQPSRLGALFACDSGLWTRDLSYHDVSIGIGWGFGSGNEQVILTYPVGTVTPT
jgi:hypothetical protein